MHISIFFWQFFSSDLRILSNPSEPDTDTRKIYEKKNNLENSRKTIS